MGTNYYVKYDNGALLHIGKAVGMGNGVVGWSSFEGQFNIEDSGEDLTSWKSWKKYISTATNFDTASIIDEYGRNILFMDLVALIECTSKEDRIRQFKKAIEAKRLNRGMGLILTSDETAKVIGRDRYWFDEDNYSFYGGEFY